MVLVFASTHLEEAAHGLQAADETKVDAILKRRKRNDAAGKEALPVGAPRFITGWRAHLLSSAEVKPIVGCIVLRSSPNHQRSSGMDIPKLEDNGKKSRQCSCETT